MFIRKNSCFAVCMIFALALSVVLWGCSSNQGESEDNGTKPTQSYQGSGAPGQHVNYDEVLTQLKAMARENPDDWTVHARLGDAYFNMMSFQDSLKHYERALELNPDDSNLYNNLGLANHYSGNTAKGLEYIEDALKKDPYYQRVWLTKGFLLAYGLGKIDEANVAWEKAVSLDPSSQVGKAANDYLREFKEKR